MSVRMPNAVAEVAPLLIRERSGRKRTITLRDRALPHRLGPDWTIGQRSKTTWYAGNPVATMQLFGPTFDTQTSFSGTWRDRYLIAEDAPVVVVEGFPQPTTAEDLVRCFEDLVRSGSELEVVWSFMRRFGILKRFSAKPDRTEDVAWTMEFEWAGEGDQAAQRKTAAPPEAHLPRVSAAMEALSDHAAFSPLDTLVAFEAKVAAAIAALEDKVTELLEQARTGALLLSAPARIVQGVRASATSIAYLAGQIIEDALGAAYTTAQVADDVASVCSAESWRRTYAFAAGQLRDEALSIARAFEARAEPDPIRVVVMDESGSLRALAQREYGTSDAWVTIATANGFEGAYVPPGTEVWVPPRGGR